MYQSMCEISNVNAYNADFPLAAEFIITGHINTYTRKDTK